MNRGVRSLLCGALCGLLAMGAGATDTRHDVSDAELLAAVAPFPQGALRARPGGAPTRRLMQGY